MVIQDEESKRASRLMVDQDGVSFSIQTTKAFSDTNRGNSSGSQELGTSSGEHQVLVP